MAERRTLGTMKVYVGQTRSTALIPRLESFGWGEMTARGELRARRQPWAYDNGAYSDWTHARAFDAAAFERDISKIQRDGLTPEFIVAPDLVAGGEKSLEFSCAWAGQLAGIAPLYLAVQDGMTVEAVGAEMDLFAGLFLGGTLTWKVREGLVFRGLAGSLGKRCHVGRCGTANRVRWARQMNADSIDSCLPLWSEENLTRFRTALDEPLAPAASFLGGDVHWGRRVAEGMGAIVTGASPGASPAPETNTANRAPREGTDEGPR